MAQNLHHKRSALRCCFGGRQTDPSEGAKGISLMIVETDSDGFARGRNLDKMGWHAADTSELFFDEVKVPADNVLGGVEGQGFYQPMQQLPAERLVIANSSVAAIERAIQLTLDYTRERKTFGNAIFDYQNTQFNYRMQGRLDGGARYGRPADTTIIGRQAGRQYGSSGEIFVHRARK